MLGEADTVGGNQMSEAKVLAERIPGAEMKVLKGQLHASSGRLRMKRIA